jgi:osmoprotectant transport system permease protein
LILGYLFDNWQRVLLLTVEHIQLSVTAVVVALLVAIPLGAAAARWERLRLPTLGVAGAVYTVPSLAFLAMLIPFLGLGKLPATVVLAAYAQVFLVRNIMVGLLGVDHAVLEAGRGMGMTGWQLFSKVRLPLALPAVIAGIRLALVASIGLGTVAAWINAGGLGTLLFDGITRDHPPMIVAGTVAVSGLAILADQLLRWVERRTSVVRAREVKAR